MTTGKVLITGGSIAGLTTAYWLAETGWDVTLLERAAQFRDGGQNVDVRGTAHDVVSRMGLVDAIAAASTTEEGTRFVDERGRILGEFPASEAQDGFTAELEILRGDLARIILDALPASVEVRYGDVVRAVHEQDRVEVRFRSGPAEAYDLLVIAEGVRSATRDLVFDGAVTRNPLGVTIAYGTIPRTAADDRWWRWMTTTRGRHVNLRPDDKGTTRAALAVLTEGGDLAALPSEEALEELSRRFDGAGWETDRIVRGFRTSDDVYLDDLTQIRMTSWAQGRTCLVGDAAWCVTPLGGGGTALALTGGYVLAAYLSTSGDHAEALRRYDAWMRPLVEKTQRLPPGVPGLVYPSSRVGVGTLRSVIRIASAKPFRKAFGRVAAVGRAERPLPGMRRVPADDGDRK